MESKVLCFHSKDKDIVELKTIFVPGTYSQEHVPGTNFKIFLKFNLSYNFSMGIKRYTLKQFENNWASSDVKYNEF